MEAQCPCTTKQGVRRQQRVPPDHSSRCMIGASIIKLRKLKACPTFKQSDEFYLRMQGFCDVPFVVHIHVPEEENESRISFYFVTNVADEE
ncbi:uncharacterized protein LOC119160846 isoform X2 [Rhipicephalus microplus]|uniref:uncharacterized protein LOC119160846 isoform X2 n=1 Tax=Rhipicephalus microplus TaxID=6941 RepID=UPI003F6B6CF0